MIVTLYCTNRKFESLMSVFVSESEVYSESGESDSLIDGDLECIQEEQEDEDSPIQMMTPNSPGNVRLTKHMYTVEPLYCIYRISPIKRRAQTNAPARINAWTVA